MRKKQIAVTLSGADEIKELINDIEDMCSNLKWKLAELEARKIKLEMDLNGVEVKDKT